MSELIKLSAHYWNSQNGLYILETRDTNENDLNVRIIGSLICSIFVSDESDNVLAVLVHREAKIVSMTIIGSDYDLVMNTIDI